MSKQMVFDDRARRKLVSGIQQLAHAVRVTLGPAGDNVIIEKSFGAPEVTRDGVTVAKAIELEDPFENMGAQILKEAAAKTNEVAGDGTTTATVLAESMVQAGQKLLSSGTSPLALREGIEKAVQAVVDELKRTAEPVRTREEVAQIGTISANNDPALGLLLADAFEQAGDHGIVTVEEGKSAETVVDFVDGVGFDKGYLSPHFVTDIQAMAAEYENARLLVHEKKISNTRDLVPLLEAVTRERVPLLIVGEDVDGDALATLVVNRMRGTLRAVAVKAPGFGDRRKAFLQDLAVATGAAVVAEEAGLALKNVTLEQLGKAARVRITKDETLVIGGGGRTEDIEARARGIRAEIEKTKSSYDREKLEERLAKLTGRVAVVRVGAHTEAELKQKKQRIEDAVNAIRSAKQEGIVAGGGVTLLRASKILDELFDDERQRGAQIVARACEAPIRQLVENAGRDGSVIVEEVRRRGPTEGWDVVSGEWVNMVTAGILDSVKMIRAALQNAASVALLMLTTETMLADNKRPVRGAVR